MVQGTANHRLELKSTKREQLNQLFKLSLNFSIQIIDEIENNLLLKQKIGKDDKSIIFFMFKRLIL